MFREYKVIRVSESGCATVFLGSSLLPTSVLERRLNREAKDGWQVVYMVVEHARYLLFWSRESLIVTLGRA
ncbi:MAG: DUF4177 domain-containing protein [Kiritimatiellia bacterium]